MKMIASALAMIIMISLFSLGMKQQEQKEIPKFPVPFIEWSYETEKPPETRYTIIIFTAPWCDTCTKLLNYLSNGYTSYYDSLLEVNKNISYSAVDASIKENEQLLSDFNVTSLPAIIILDNEKEIYRNSGNVKFELESMPSLIQLVTICGEL